MTNWTPEELAAIGTTDELDLRSRRGDGSLRDPVTMWVVRHGDDLYVRAVKGVTAGIAARRAGTRATSAQPESTRMSRSPMPTPMLA
jgi:hypothetical protein